MNIYRAIVVSGIASLGALLVSLYTIVGHLRRWTRPDLQRSIVRILLIVPVYAIASFVSFVDPSMVCKYINDSG